MELPEENLHIPLPGYIEAPGAGTGSNDIPEPEVTVEFGEVLEIVGEEPEDNLTPSLIIDNSEFQRRVEVIMMAIHPDNQNSEVNTRRLLAEVHTYLSLFDEGMRQSMLDMASMGGPFGLIKKMLKSK